MTHIPVPPELIEGAVSLERVDGGLRPWRIPHEERGLFYPEDGIQGKAQAPAGVRLRFRTSASRIELGIAPGATERLFDLVTGDTVLRTAVLHPGQERAVFDGLAGEERVCEIWLPTHVPVTVRSLSVDTDAAPQAVPDRRLRWVAYGSSITHCEAPNSPARTWPALVARRCNLHLTCLGFGGNCMLEPLAGLLVRDLDADVITLKLGINVHGQSTLSARTYQPALIGLVRIIREKHRNTPIGVITPIICPKRESTRNQVQRTLEDYRRDTFAAVQRLCEHGDRHLHFFDGRELLGSGETHHLHDGLHPDGDGYELIGERATRMVFPALMDDMAAQNHG